MASIPLPALHVQTPESPVETMSKVAQLHSLLNQQQLQGQAVQQGQINLREQQQQVQDRQTFNQALRDNNGDWGAALKSVAGKVSPNTLAGLEKTHLENVKAYADADKATREKLSDQGSRLSALVAQAKALPPDQYAQQFPQIAAAAKQINPELQVDPAQPIPQDHLDAIQLGLMTQEQYLSQTKEAHEQKMRGPQEDKGQADAEKARLEADAMKKFGGLTPQLAESRYISIQQKQNMGQSVSPDDVAFKKAYEKNKTMNTQIRVDAMGQNREYPVLDTKNGNALQYVSAADLNAANHAEPGRYVPAGEGQKALTKTALIEDIRGTIQQARASLQNPNMPEFTAAQRAQIAVALGGPDPATALSAAFRGGVLGSLSPEQQDYLINHAQLVENAMAMRSVLGAGQGSEDMRRAIKDTIPGPNTPSKEYALKQLDKFEATLNRVSRGVATVPLKGAAPAQSGGQKVTATGPDGHQIEVRNGIWVDSATGKPVQGK